MMFVQSSYVIILGRHSSREKVTGISNPLIESSRQVVTKSMTNYSPFQD